MTASKHMVNSDPPDEFPRSTQQRVLTAPDLQQELLSNLHLVKHFRFRLPKQKEPNVTLRAEPQLLTQCKIRVRSNVGLGKHW